MEDRCVAHLHPIVMVSRLRHSQLLKLLDSNFFMAKWPWPQAFNWLTAFVGAWFCSVIECSTLMLPRRRALGELQRWKIKSMEFILEKYLTANAPKRERFSGLHNQIALNGYMSSSLSRSGSTSAFGLAWDLFKLDKDKFRQISCTSTSASIKSITYNLLVKETTASSLAHLRCNIGIWDECRSCWAL